MELFEDCILSKLGKNCKLINDMQVSGIHNLFSVFLEVFHFPSTFFRTKPCVTNDYALEVICFLPNMGIMLWQKVHPIISKLDMGVNCFLGSLADL